MAGSLSPLQLQAAAGLFQNQGLDVNANLVAAVDAYTSTSLLTPLIAAIGNAGPNVGNLTPNAIANLQTFASNTCPALADSIVPGTTAIVTPTLANPGMTGIVTLTAEAYMGNGDLSKFVQTFTQANGYCSTVNVFINSAVNANSYLGPTFVGMDNLATGGLTEINRATAAMGDDLYNAGYYIDLGNLSNYGTPLALIQQISRRAGTISPLITALSNAGVPDSIILNLNDSAVVITDSVQKLMYNALLGVTGDELANILRILDVWTPNINTLADLLNPAVMLPNSYPSLTTPTADGPRAVYITPPIEPPVDYDNLTPEQSQAILDEEAAARAIDRPLACEIRQSDNPVTAGSAAAPVTGDTSGNTGSGNQYTPNSELEALVSSDQTGISYERLSVMTTPGLALVNKALAGALDQVTNVGRMTLPQLAAAFLAAETNKGLLAIEAQTEPLSTPDVSYYANSIATGSGVNGTILLTDILGTAAGTTVTASIGNCISIINTLYDVDSSNIANLITEYNNILANTLASDNGNVELSISKAANIIGNIANANPTETASLNTNFLAISTQITTETGLQVKAGIDIGNVEGNNQPSIMSFVSSLPGYGLDTKVGGSAQYLEDVAVTSPTVVTTYIGLNSGNIEVGNTAGILPGDVVINNPYFANIAVANVVSGNTLTMTGNTTGTLVPDAVLTFVKKPGQTIVAVLREGRTTAGLNAAGVGTSATTVNPTPSTPPPQAVLSSSRISERQAQSQVIY